MKPSEMPTATLRCTECGAESECWVQPDTKVGDVLDTGECDGCDPFRLDEDDDQAGGRYTARVVRIEPAKPAP